MRLTKLLSEKKIYYLSTYKPIVFFLFFFSSFFFIYLFYYHNVYVSPNTLYLQQTVCLWSTVFITFIFSNNRLPLKNLNIIFNDRLHGPSMFAVKANIFGVLYNQSSSIAFDETSSYWSAQKTHNFRLFICHHTVVRFPLVSISLPRG